MAKRLWTTNDLGVLLWTYASLAPYPISSPAHDRCYRRLADRGLIVFKGNAWTLTDKGTVFAERLRGTPEPALMWGYTEDNNGE